MGRDGERCGGRSRHSADPEVSEIHAALLVDVHAQPAVAVAAIAGAGASASPAIAAVAGLIEWHERLAGLIDRERVRPAIAHGARPCRDRHSRRPGSDTSGAPRCRWLPMLTLIQLRRWCSSTRRSPA